MAIRFQKFMRLFFGSGITHFLLFFLLFQSSLLADASGIPCFKHRKFRSELTNLIKELKILVSFGFLLSEDPAYSVITNANYANYRTFARRLEDDGDLALSKLELFHQFNERFDITNQASSIAKEQELININHRFANNRIQYDQAINNINLALNRLSISKQNTENLRNASIVQFLNYYSCCAKRSLPIIRDHTVLALTIGDFGAAAIYMMNLLKWLRLVHLNISYLKIV